VWLWEEWSPDDLGVHTWCTPGLWGDRACDVLHQGLHSKYLCPAKGTIDPADLGLFQYVETAEQAWTAIKA
jgi:hypothetical protein